MYLQPLDVETRGAITHEVARMLGVDGQAANRGPHLTVEEIDVRYINENDHEDVITTVAGAELNGEHVGLDSIIGVIESAVTRDALSRYGTCAYALYFHLKGGQRNRGRFPFFVPGAAHTIRGGGEGSSLARRNGRGESMDSQTAAEALKVSVELLRWSTEERRVNDDRSAALFSSFEKVLRQQNEVIQNYSDREMRIMQLESDLNERKYELEQKRKADEDKQKWMGEAIEVAKTYGPMLLPPVIETIRKFNSGPNYVPNETAVFEKIRQAQEAAAREAAARGTGEADGEEEGAPANGVAPPPQTNGAARPAAPPPAAANGASAPDPKEAERAQAITFVQNRIAFDLCRLIALAKSTESDSIIREALANEAEILQVFEAAVVATAAPDADKHVDDLVQMSLGFGGALQASPLLALKIVRSIKNDFMKAALMEFAELLKQYVKLLEQA